MDFSQILTDDKDLQLLLVNGPKMRPTNPSWWTAAILKKIEKFTYLCNCSTDFQKKIWHGNASGLNAPDGVLIFPILNIYIFIIWIVH